MSRQRSRAGLNYFDWLTIVTLVFLIALCATVLVYEEAKHDKAMDSLKIRLDSPR